jgi:hypothetical protein
MHFLLDANICYYVLHNMIWNGKNCNIDEFMIQLKVENVFVNGKKLSYVG